MNLPSRAVVGLVACMSVMGCAHHRRLPPAEVAAVNVDSMQSQLNSSITGAAITVQTIISHGTPVVVLNGHVPAKADRKQASLIAKRLAPGYRISNKTIASSIDG
jgi:hypothetical protein